jgi:hypothetical protein
MPGRVYPWEMFPRFGLNLFYCGQYYKIEAFFQDLNFVVSATLAGQARNLFFLSEPVQQ